MAEERKQEELKEKHSEARQQKTIHQSAGGHTDFVH